jgi:hypothetical protein
MASTGKPWTPAQMRTFNRLTLAVCSRNQMARINARLDLAKFYRETGETVCDAMMQELRRRDEKRGSR